MYFADNYVQYFVTVATGWSQMHDFKVITVEDTVTSSVYIVGHLKFDTMSLKSL